MSSAPPSTPISVLLVEDDPGDVLMTREALADSKLLNELAVASDGEEAIEYLRAAAETGTPKKPDLILLDLNLPRVDGREVLEFVKSHERLRRIPVVVLTTSSAEEDIVRSYDLHANAYITKPVDFEQFMSVVRKVDEFFITVVRRAST
jgi:CheY-like chemotaxis protein